MDDFRLHQALCPHGRPLDGTRRLDVFFDYAAFPVWGWGILPARGDRPERAVYGMLRPEPLGLSADLTAALWAWARYHERTAAWGATEPSTPEQQRAWSSEGRALAARLAGETGAAVVYRWPIDGRDPDCPHCGPD